MVLGGCPPAIFTEPPLSGTAASISAKSQWHAYGDLRNPQYAIDGNLDTAAISGPGYENARLTIDLGRRCLFNMVVIDQGPRDPDGYCRRVAVQISYDGVNYYQVYSASGTRRITYCPIMTPTMARYVRLVATVPGDRPWSVAEVYLE